MNTSEGEKSEESKNDVGEDTELSPIPETETSSGINGDKEMEIDENNTENNKEEENAEDDKKTENQCEDEVIPTKKRKFNDSGELSDDSSSTEFLGFPDTSTEEAKKVAAAKKEKQEKVKLDLLTFDAEAFGKGKRSRVPNKRYEGTIRSFSKRFNEMLDNDNDIIGDDGRNFEENDDEISSSHSSPRTKSRVAASPATPGHTQKKQKIDMSNPNYLKPFEFGWKRELVYRATMDNNFRRNGDIYYYTPSGKKIRSLRELSDTLKSEKITELTMEDFTFFKEPVGLNDPDKEIIREAKYKTATLQRAGLMKSKSSKNSSPKVASETSTKNTRSPRLGGFKVKITGSSKLNQGSSKKDKRASVDNEMEMGMLPPAWSPKKGSTAKQSNYAKTGSLSGSPLDAKPCRPCSIRCEGVSGLIPTLQCRLCLCLYHKECVGELTDDVPGGYTCKNCQLDNQDKIESTYESTPSIGPPPLTPISSLKSNNTLSSTPPKLQRIPRSANESPPSITQSCDKSSLSTSNEKPTIPVSSDPPPVKEESNSTFGETIKENQVESTPSKTRRGGSNKKTPAVSAPVMKNDVESRFMQNYLQNLSYGYQTLLYVFQYLKVQDLLRAGCVCTLWRDIAGHPSLWSTVRMKNSQVANWEGLADALKKHRTKNLDLRKMLLPSTGDDMWAQFSKAIARVDSLVRIELCRCPASVIEQLATTNKNLQVINAVMIRCESMEISSLDNLENLQELRLKSTNGFVLTSDLTPLKKLTNLKHLSLTSIKDLNKQNVQVIGDLINLESLDLGECSDFPENFGTDVIMKLIKLEKLRLEKGQGSCCTFNILDAVSKISCLEQLELVNFDVKAGFDKALGACANIKKLLIIPTYISQSATTNHMVLGGVIKLKSTLSHFVWGVTLELLRVTELFVDQCEDSPNKDKKKPTGNGDSIPVLKPVPIMKTDETKDESSSKEQPQVEILPLPTLQKLLLNCLPTTRVKILKIPFHATWRQSIVDTVN